MKRDGDGMGEIRVKEGLFNGMFNILNKRHGKIEIV